MDGFFMFILWTCITCGAAYGAGTLLSGQEILNDCAKNGEIVRKNTVIACTTTHAIVNGQRIKLEQ